MGLASMFLGEQNPFAQWVGQHSNMLGTIGSGLMQGQNLQHGLQIAGGALPEANQLDLQQAEKLKADALAKSQLNATTAYLKQKYPQIATMVEQGVISPGEGFKMAYQQDNAPQGEGFTLSAGQTRYGPDGKPIVTAPVNAPDPMEGWTDDMKEYYMSVQQGNKQSFYDFLKTPRTSRQSAPPAIPGGINNPLRQDGMIPAAFEMPGTTSQSTRTAPFETAKWKDYFNSVMYGDYKGTFADFLGKDAQAATFDREKDLSTQYYNQEPLKTYREVRNGYERVRAGAQQNTGQGDVGVVYGYMKMLDPGSVVREGEFATAEQTSGAAQQLVGIYNRILNGERLTPEQRKGFLDAAQAYYDETSKNLSDINAQFSDRANAYGVEPSRFIVTPEQYQAILFNQPVRIQNDDDYAKLPSGAEFIGPDGTLRKKP